jgi:hypothetical protein
MLPLNNLAALQAMRGQQPVGALPPFHPGMPFGGVGNPNVPQNGIGDPQAPPLQPPVQYSGPVGAPVPPVIRPVAPSLYGGMNPAMQNGMQYPRLGALTNMLAQPAY